MKSESEEAKPTAGPWYNPPGSVSVFSVEKRIDDSWPKKPNPVKVCDTSTHAKSVPEAEANARLTAAAPELRDLVKQYAITCQERIQAEKEPGDGWDEEVVHHYELLLADCRRVLAKAEGRK